MNCPVCGSNNTGKIGSDEYYCANCLLEFARHGGKLEYYYINEEGTSVLLKNKNAAKKMAALIQAEKENSEDLAGLAIIKV